MEKNKERMRPMNPLIQNMSDRAIKGQIEEYDRKKKVPKGAGDDVYYDALKAEAKHRGL